MLSNYSKRISRDKSKPSDAGAKTVGADTEPQIPDVDPAQQSDWRDNTERETLIDKATKFDYLKS